MDFVLCRRKKGSKVKFKLNLTIGVDYFFPSLHSVKMENFLQLREGKESMVNIHEIEGIVEVLYRGIGVRRVGNRMVRGPMLSLNGCHCRDY